MDYAILRDISNARRLQSRQSRDYMQAWVGLAPDLYETAGPAEIQIELESMTAREARDMGRDPEVLGIALSMPTRLIETSPCLKPDTSSPPWGLETIGASNSDYDGTGVRVAMLDTGIDPDHESFEGVDLSQKDFSATGNGDRNGHGTHCAGILFGREADGRRIGVATGIGRGMIGKVLDDAGRGTSAMLFDGLIWAAQSGADIITLCLAFDFPALVDRLVNEEGFPADLATAFALENYRANHSIFSAIMCHLRSGEAYGRGALVIAAAGNASHRETGPDHEVSVGLPADAGGVISVGALQNSAAGFAVAPFSNSGPVLSAPGVNVISAKPGGGLTALSGTSMACMHVAGCCALWWQAVSEMKVPLTLNNVSARMLAACSADTFAPGTGIPDRGLGIVQAP